MVRLKKTQGEKEMKKKVQVILNCMVILVLVSGFTVFPVCSNFLELANGNMTYMSCHYMMKMGMLVGILFVSLSVEQFWGKRNIKVLYSVLGVILILLTVNSPIFDGPCRNVMMDCQKTAWCFRVAGVISLIIGGMQLIEEKGNRI